MVFVGKPNERYIHALCTLCYSVQNVLVQSVCLANLTLYPISVHGMAEASFGNRNEDADSRFLGISEYNAYWICRQGFTVRTSKQSINGLFAAKPFCLLQTKAVIHYVVSSMRLMRQ